MSKPTKDISILAAFCEAAAGVRAVAGGMGRKVINGLACDILDAIAQRMSKIARLTNQDDWPDNAADAKDELLARALRHRAERVLRPREGVDATPDLAKHTPGCRPFNCRHVHQLLLADDDTLAAVASAMTLPNGPGGVIVGITPRGVTITPAPDVPVTPSDPMSGIDDDEDADESHNDDEDASGE